jgi:hypothetical protein
MVLDCLDLWSYVVIVAARICRWQENATAKTGSIASGLSTGTWVSQMAYAEESFHAEVRGRPSRSGPKNE